MNHSSYLSISKIIVGSKNQNKVGAVREVIADLNYFENVEITGSSAPSGVSDQPLTLEETIQGAQNRAAHAHEPGSLSVGLEGGLMKVSPSADQFFHVCVCSVFDGESHHLGMSSLFRLPQKVSALIVDEGLELAQALKKCGFTDHPSIGSTGGAISIFTNGRLQRKEYCKQSLITALISIDQGQYFATGTD